MSHVSSEPAVEFFGERWDAPVVDEAVQVPTPVGVECLNCTEPVQYGDRGLMRWYHRMQDGKPVATSEPVHLECDLRSVMGGIGHLRGQCLCGGHPDGDPDGGLSYRESARKVLAAMEQLRGKPL